ncbi:hypothetical protein [Alteromonas sp. KUL49]|uniref:hypothetical protein n=1 Tax=Alteromonas sp. KUL49 TaxID=2480798 RepID=UPI00102F0D34|nr:hypothetical protein [Alteromonas sp. KUL49]TAP34136.1 hypothetical protein EYS00_19670 [Alteromonas sp. KUL49]GEA13621.1 hypothetical protein KUL49_39960 [Alteromonas sp. KUL49]
MESWETISFKGETPIQFILETIPEAPAIYSFTLNLRMEEKYYQPDSYGSIELWADSVCSELERILNLPHGMQLNSTLGAFESVGIRYGMNFPFSYIKPINFVKLQTENPSFIKFLKAFIGKLSNFSSAMYVGESHDLNKRVKQHLNADSDLTRRLSSEGIDYKDLNLNYILLDDLEISYSELMEEEDITQESTSLMAFFNAGNVSTSENPEKS